jgi:hypothetical protein
MMTDLLQLALDAHGGLAVWHSIRQIDVQLSISGGLWKVKGHGDGLPDISMKIDVREPKLAISPFKAPGQVGHFRPDRVWIEHDGAVLEQRSSPEIHLSGTCERRHRTIFMNYISRGTLSGITSRRRSF